MNDDHFSKLLDSWWKRSSPISGRPHGLGLVSDRLQTLLRCNPYSTLAAICSAYPRALLTFSDTSIVPARIIGLIRFGQGAKHMNIYT